MRDYTVSMTMPDGDFRVTTVLARNIEDAKRKVERFSPDTAYLRKYNARGDHLGAPWAFSARLGWSKLDRVQMDAR